MNRDFMECGTCIVKPGSPTLCKSCLYNRELVSDLKNAVRRAAHRPLVETILVFLGILFVPLWVIYLIT